MSDYPELELPNLEPYRPPESWTFNGSLLVPYEIETSNMTCDGFKDLIVGNFRCVDFHKVCYDTFIPYLTHSLLMPFST